MRQVNTLSGFGFAKALIFGEYAVMHGAYGLVASLDTPCTVSFDNTSDSDIDDSASSPLRAALHQCLHQFSSIETTLKIDNSAFFDEHHIKLGIGSSAAAFAALFDLLRQTATDKPFDDIDVIQAHRQFQNGLGSGIDVLAAIHGGIQLIHQCPHHPVRTPIPEQNLPPFALIATHSQAPTSTFIQAAKSVENSHDYQLIIHDLSELYHDLANSVILANKIDFLEQIENVSALLSRLEKVIGLTIIPTGFDDIKKIAQSCGVTIKTSGAGGGDILIAMALSSQQLDLFCDRLPNGLTRLPFHIAPSR